MPLPRKALLESQLRLLTAGAVAKSGHEVVQVAFIDVDGEEKTGFLKRLDPTYPRILALYACLVSLIMRLSLGKRAAEDRLVYDDVTREIIGTVSIACPNFKPISSEGPLSVETLMANNVAALWVASWRYGEDDLHEGNQSLKERIDFDMALYWITYIMKGGRWIDGILKEIPERSMAVKGSDLENFPIIPNRTHWPANTIPGNYNYYKTWTSASNVRELAANKVLQIEGNPKPISWQEQYFSAIFHELLVFDPQLFRAHLEDYFGEEPLNYTSLETDKKNALELKQPKLFNAKTNTEPFVHHAMNVIQENYDDLWKAAVFFRGVDKNISGVPVISFRHFLECRPSVFKESSNWIDAQNKQILASERKIAAKLSEGLACSSSDAGTSSDQINQRLFYNSDIVQKRYHKIWRDAHTEIIRDALNSLSELIQQISRSQEQVSLVPSSSSSESSSHLDQVDTSSVTEAWQLLTTSTNLSRIKKTSEENSFIDEGLLILEQFIAQAHACANSYYILTLEELTKKHSCEFTNNLSKIILKHQRKFLEVMDNSHRLPEAADWLRKFVKITRELKEFCNSFSFHELQHSSDTHFFGKQEPSSVILTSEHTSEEIIRSGLDAFFDWVDTLAPGELDHAINKVITNDYEPGAGLSSYLFARKRGEAVRGYLKRTEDGREKNSIRLATILSTGGCESTSLNTRLIANLIPWMLNITNGITEVEGKYRLVSLRSACSRNSQFNVAIYTEKAMSYVREHKRFAKVTNNMMFMHEFNTRMYEWIETVEIDLLHLYSKLALNNYKAKSWTAHGYGSVGTLFGFSQPPKTEYLEKAPQTLNKVNKTQWFMNFFKEGGIEETSANTLLIKKLLERMKADISSNPEKVRDERNGVILRAEADNAFISSIQRFAQESLTPRSSLASASCTF